MNYVKPPESFVVSGGGNPVSVSLFLICLAAGLGISVPFRTPLPIIAGALAGIYLLFAIKVAKQWERVVVLRFGRYRGLRGPGLFVIIPVIDSLSRFVDQRVRVTNVNAESALTRDTVPVNVDAIVFWVVWNAEKCILEVEDFQKSISMSAQTALLESIGRHELAQMITEREMLGRELQRILDEKTTSWGITVQSVEIRDVHIPPALEDAMSRQAQAERERQARIVLGTAEAEISAKFAEASQLYQDNPIALHLRAMNMLYEAIKEKGSMGDCAFLGCGKYESRRDHGNGFARQGPQIGEFEFRCILQTALTSVPGRGDVMGKLDGKVAVVTGGNSGIGLATAQRFASEGAYVFITGRRQGELEQALKQIGGNASGVQGDVSKLADLDRLYGTVKEQKGRIDILFANAGLGEFAPLGAITEEHFDKTFAVNVKGVLFTVQKALPLMPEGSSIILNASIVASKGPAAMSVYSATKAAVRSFARTWTSDLKERKIRVNAISPGPIETPGWNGLAKNEDEQRQFRSIMIASVPMGRLGTSDEIAKAAVFLASDDSSFITGIELFVDGGAAQI